MRIEAKQVAPAVSDTQLRAADASGAEFGPWNPGIVSQLPVELRHLCTVFRAENVSTSLSAATELQSLTGLPATELVAFRPQRLVLHEVLIRVTAELSVPDGSRIEDLGINFRKITSRLIRGYLEPQMPAITAAFVQTRRSLAGAIHSAFADVVDAAPAQVSAGRSPLLRLWSRRRSAPPPAAEPAGWGLAQIAACEHQASTTGDALQGAACRSLAHVLSALFATHGGAWGTRELIESLATDIACNTYGSTASGSSLIRSCGRRRGARASTCCRSSSTRWSSIPRGLRPRARARCARCKGASPATSACAGATSHSSARTSGASNCSTTARSAPRTSTPAL